MGDDKKKHHHGEDVGHSAREIAEDERPKAESTSEFDSSDFESDDRKGGAVLETVKKLFTVGVSAAFMTEESIRNYLGDLKLPKDVLQMILQTASRGKEEMMNRVSKEIMGILQKVDVPAEVAKFLTNHRIRVSAEIEILPPKDKKD